MKFEVEETPKMRENIEKHKRVFENYKLPPYVFEYENNYYYYIDFSIFSRLSKGVLILNSDGSVADRDIAIKVYEYITIYDTAIRNYPQLVSHIERPIWPFVEMNTSIEHIKDVCDLKSIGLSEEINQIYENHKYLLQIQYELFPIHEQLAQLDNTLHENSGILTIKDVRKAEQLVYNWQKLLYGSGRKLLNLGPIKKKVVKNLLKKCKMSTIEHNNIKTELVTLLMADINTNRKLKKSLRRFEKDKDNKRTVFSNGEQGLDEMIKNINEILNKHFIEKLLPYLRN